MSFLDNIPTNLKIQVQDVIAAYPPSEDVFRCLIDTLTNTTNGSSPAKKRKIDTTPPSSSISDNIEFPSSLESSGCNIVLQIPELSVQSPVRKKLNLVFVTFPSNPRKVSLILTKSKEARPEFILADITSKNVKFASILRTPDRKNFRSLIIEYNVNLGNTHKNDILLITFNNDTLTEQFGPVLGDDGLVPFLINRFKAFGLPITDGTSSEDNFCVETYKGTKEGHLYFMPDHVIFGFKKPTIVFNCNDIEAITYTSITRLTFNVTLQVRTEGSLLDDESETFEFSMVDQKEFDKIDQYVKSQDFTNRSMADEYKATIQLKTNNPTDRPNNLAEAARQVPGGEQLIGGGQNGDDEDEEDDDYEVGDSDDNHSDQSGDDDEENFSDDDTTSSDVQEIQSVQQPQMDLDQDKDDYEDEDDEEDGDHDGQDESGEDDDESDEDGDASFGQLPEYDADELQKELNALNQLDDVDDAGYLQFVQQNYNQQL